MKTVILFGQLTLDVPDKDWDFLCKYRFFTQNPSVEDVQTEFVTGTGITKNKPHMWNEAGKRFSEYVDDLRDIQKMDLNVIARELLTDKEKYNKI